MNVLDAIGNTSLVRLRRLVPAGCAEILVKLEWENPTGSMKDRMANAVISRAEADGRLRPGGAVVEYTGGSTGASLALVCAAKGYRIRIVTSDAFSTEKRDQMAALGAELTIVPSEGGMTTKKLIVDMIESNRFGRIIWDTAPAGETLNLLNMPQFIRRHLTAGAKVFEGLDKIGKQLVGRRSISATMDEWIRLSERIARFVHDRTEFVVVANPEALVTRHVERLMRTLREYRVDIRGMVINGVIEATDSGTLRSMQAVQAAHVAELKSLAGGLPMAILALSQNEIRGLTALRAVGASLCGQLGLE